MPDITYDLRYLRYAVLVSETGSFRRTAEMLSVSQSTVSRRIQLLERRIGVALFERHRSGARVTLAGERFLKEAVIGARHLHQAVDSVVQAKRGSTGVLRVGLTAYLANGFLAELLAAYHHRYPAIDVFFEEAASQISARALLSSRLDAAFVPGDPRLPGCRAERLWGEKIYVAVPEPHVVALSDAASWDDVKRETFLVTADAAGPEIEDYLMRHLSDRGIRPRVSVQRVGCDNLLNMVAQGFGITVTTNSTALIGYPGVRFVPIISDEDTISYSVVWSETNHNPALKLLIEMSLDHARRSGTR
ncbi:LysR family transcriptional regulator [Mesorhizobium sp. M1066]|uniref:LysR family transcriptional regulator n=1 Tax=unclassified Mesorhizobium TaxID=325217 RepID=UPI00333AD19D